MMMTRKIAMISTTTMSGLETIDVDFVDHVHELRFRGVLSERPHDRSKFSGADRSIAVLVKHGERFLKLCVT